MAIWAVYRISADIRIIADFTHIPESQITKNPAVLRDNFIKKLSNFNYLNDWWRRRDSNSRPND